MTGLHTHPEVPEADMKTYVLINGRELIRALLKPHGCKTFGDYTDVFMQNVTRHFGEHKTQLMWESLSMDSTSLFHSVGLIQCIALESNNADRAEGYERVLVICRDTNTKLFLMHLTPTKTAQG